MIRALAAYLVAHRCDAAGHRNDLEPLTGSGSFWLGGGRTAQWLVVAGRVDGELADECAGGGVDDPDVQVVDEHEDCGAGVLVADADVVEFPADAQGELAGRVVRSVRTRWWVPTVRSPGAALGLAGRRWPGCLVRERLVRAAGVVDDGERVELGLQLGFQALRPPRPPANRVVKTSPLPL
jgi:hypothetical protein